MGETKQTLNIRAEERITASSLQVKGVTLQSTAGNTIMTLTGNIRKYWILRKTGKQEHQGGNLLRRKRASYQWNILQVTKYSETNTVRKQSKENNHQNYNIIKLSPQRSTNKYGSIKVRNQSQPIRNYLKIF